MMSVFEAYMIIVSLILFFTDMALYNGSTNVTDLDSDTFKIVVDDVDNKWKDLAACGTSRYALRYV